MRTHNMLPEFCHSPHVALIPSVYWIWLHGCCFFDSQYYENISQSSYCVTIENVVLYKRDRKNYIPRIHSTLHLECMLFRRMAIATASATACTGLGWMQAGRQSSICQHCCFCNFMYICMFDHRQLHVSLVCSWFADVLKQYNRKSTNMLMPQWGLQPSHVQWMELFTTSTLNKMLR